jgi:hypothetical protein
MKTMKLQKMNLLLCAAMVCLFLIPSFVTAQEKDKTMHIKKVKVENGKETVIDTIIQLSDLEQLKVLEDLGIKLDEELKSLENLDVEVFVSEGEKGEESFNVMIKSDGEDQVENFIFISEDGEMEELKVAGNKYFYTTKTDSEEMESTIEVLNEEDLNWSTDMEMDVEVEDLDNGNKKVTIKKEDGETMEHILDQGKGVYMIDADGKLTKLEDEDHIEWNAKGNNDRILITVGEDDGNIMVIRNKNETIDMVDPYGKQRVMVKESEGSDEKEVHVRVMKKNEGNKSIVIRTKVIMEKLSEQEVQTLKDAGVDVEGEAGSEKLEMDDLKFHPNPNDGKFNLSFETPENGNTEIKIFDVNGKEVYSEKIENFNGRYENMIDISGNKQGTYFLHIRQDNKVSTRKIVLE